MTVSLPVLREEFVTPDLCGPCGGHCCQGYPGAAFPSDFGQNLKEIESNLLDALISGRWALDFWEGYFGENPPVWEAKYVRPSVKGKEGWVLDPTWGGPCTFHSASLGC